MNRPLILCLIVFGAVGSAPAAVLLDTHPAMMGHAGGSPGSSAGPKQIVISDNGDAMAVWLESEGPERAGPWMAMAAQYHAATDTWAEPVIISHPSLGADIMNWYRLAGDGRGNYLATWQQEANGAFSIWVNRYLAGGGWRTPQLIETDSANSYDPEVAMAYDPTVDETKAVVAWARGGESGLHVMVNRLVDFDNNTWAGPEPAENWSVPMNAPGTRVAMASNGDFMLICRINHPYPPLDYFYRHYDWETGWSGSEALLETQTPDCSRARLSMNSSGEAIVAWPQKTGTGGAYQLWARRWNGAGWDGEPELISDDPDHGISWGNFDVDMSNNAEAMVVYTQQRGGTEFHDAYVRRHDGTQWTTLDGDPEIIKLDSEDLGDVGAGRMTVFDPNLDLAMDDTGNAIAVWTQDDGTNVNIWSAIFNGTSWGGPQKVENAPLDAWGPVVHINGSGVGQVIWAQFDGELDHVYATPVSIPEPPSILLAAVAAAAGLLAWAGRQRRRSFPSANCPSPGDG